MTDNTQAHVDNGLDLVWGGAAIGEAIGRNQRQAYWLLENGNIPARKVGETWVASRVVLRRHILGEAA